MSKHQQQNKVRPTNRVSTSIPVGPETPSNGEFIPAYEEIQIRAYQIHEAKGGSDLENWLEAELVLKEEHRDRS